jgi:S1-C subfamily serine protease
MSTPSRGRPTVLAAGVALFALVGLACGSDSEPEAEPQRASRSSEGARPLAAERLLTRLRSGGLVVMFRHAATDPSDEDDPDVDLDDCTTQRNLTGEGRADARRIGAAFRDLRIPVGAVWASPYCRARDTADLAFGRNRVVSGLERLYPILDEAADRRMNRLIREHAPESGDPNLVISAHGVYPSVLEPAVTLEEGEAAVYDVGASNVRLLGRIAPDEWAGLASGAAPSADGAPRGLAERLQRSVVSVELREGEHAGAAFRVAVDGIVVTGADVVGDSDDVTVVRRDGTRRPARVLGRAPEAGVAVLELDDDSGLPAMHSGSGLAAARGGDSVLALGSAVGPAPAVGSATIEALRAPVRLGGGELDLLEIDAPIDPAQSGAPLVNERGDVLGVVTAEATPRDRDASTATGFAIPVDVARSAALEIVYRRSGYARYRGLTILAGGPAPRRGASTPSDRRA